MNYWRMSMRWGNDGRDYFPECRRRGVAAMGYYYGPNDEPIVGDCRKITPTEFDAAWRAKDPHNTSARSSMRCLAYEVKVGDVIYARSSPFIVARGEVTEGYAFDPSLMEGTDCRWEHFVRVAWVELPRFEAPEAVQPAQYALWRLDDHKLQILRSQESKEVEASVLRGMEEMSRTDDAYSEGQRSTRLVTRFERSLKLRTAAVAIHGTRCQACGLSFGEVYGELGDGFIEVHHLKPVADYLGETNVDPASDMAVVCPNCHRMLHRRAGTPLTIEELRAMSKDG